jgi:hypothetical protein
MEIDDLADMFVDEAKLINCILLCFFKGDALQVPPLCVFVVSASLFLPEMVRNQKSLW